MTVASALRAPDHTHTHRRASVARRHTQLKRKRKKAPSSIFDQLSITEIHTVADYLEVAGLVDHRFASGLADLVYEDLRAHGGRVIMNSNVGIEYQLLAPVKAEAAAFLSGESGIPPARFAKVTVFRGAASPRDVMQYKVGPLGGVTSMAATEMLAAGSWKWARRPENYAMEKAFWQMPVGVTMNTLSRLMAASSSRNGARCGVGHRPRAISRRLTSHTYDIGEALQPQHVEPSSLARVPRIGHQVGLAFVW